MGGAGSKTSDVIMRGKDMKGMTAIVTGAGSGIGAEMARQMAAAGARYPAPHDSSCTPMKRALFAEHRGHVRR